MSNGLPLIFLPNIPLTKFLPRIFFCLDDVSANHGLSFFPIFSLFGKQGGVSPFSVGLSSGVNDHIALFVPPWSAQFGSRSRGGAGFSKVIVAGLKKGIIEVQYPSKKSRAGSLEKNGAMRDDD